MKQLANTGELLQEHKKWNDFNLGWSLVPDEEQRFGIKTWFS